MGQEGCGHQYVTQPRLIVTVFICQLVAGMFEGTHHRLVFGSNGREAVDHVITVHPDRPGLDTFGEEMRFVNVLRPDARRQAIVGRMVKIFELAFPREVTLRPSPVL